MSEPVTPPPAAPPATPPPQNTHDLPGMGFKLPWLGAGVGAAAGAGLDLLSGRPRNWRRTLRKSLTGAATGIGGELGLRLGGELARRHSVAGGGPEMAAMTPLVTGGLGAGAGYLLGRERPDDEDDE